jgi:IS5 family transposase
LIAAWLWGDCAYQGQRDAISAAAPAAKDMTNRRAVRGRPLSDAERSKNATKSIVRVGDEHPFLIIKQIFGFAHARYRGLAKKKNRFEVVCALVNLYIERHALLRRCHA